MHQASAIALEATGYIIKPYGQLISTRDDLMQTFFIEQLIENRNKFTIDYFSPTNFGQNWNIKQIYTKSDGRYKPTEFSLYKNDYMCGLDLRVSSDDLIAI